MAAGVFEAAAASAVDRNVNTWIWNLKIVEPAAMQSKFQLKIQTKIKYHEKFKFISGVCLS